MKVSAQQMLDLFVCTSQLLQPLQGRSCLLLLQYVAEIHLLHRGFGWRDLACDAHGISMSENVFIHIRTQERGDENCSRSAFPFGSRL